MYVALFDVKKGGIIISTTFIAIIKALMKIITDEEFRKNLVFIFLTIIITVLIILITVASLPSILISTFATHMFPDTNIPESSIIESIQTKENVIEDKAKVAMYQDAIIKIDQLNQEWIEKIKKSNKDCDEFEVIYNYDLTWESLIAIDAVRLKQDFTRINSKDIEKIGLLFLTREISFETRTIEEDTVIKVGIITINTKEFEEVLPEVSIVEEEDILLATNIYQTICFVDIEGSLNIYDNTIDLSNLEEYSEGFANIPYFNQTDKRWGANSYGKSTILEGGCGPTSLAMVVAGLTEHKVTPLDIANWSVTNGHRAEGAGSYWSLMTEGGKYYGLNVEPVSRKDPNTIKKALSEGKPIIVSMGKGHFTSGGHFIVLRGLTSDGKILVYDPVSIKRSNQAWDFSIIMNESSTNGGKKGSPFWIFSKLSSN